MDVLKPTFGDTKSYQEFKDFSDTATSGLNILSKLVFKRSEVNSISENGEGKELASLGESKLNKKEAMEAEEFHDSSFDVFNL